MREHIERVPLTDAEIVAATVGEPALLRGPVHLADYDPEWPVHFGQEAAAIREALGSAALRIEHVGSTSVAGLPAKPIIDMLLVVADSAAEPAYVPALEAAGYVLRIREPDWYEHRVFKGPRINLNLHVVTEGCPEITRMLGFRDHLRSHDADRDLYAGTKRELAARDWKYVQNYADAKTAVIEAILARAVEGTSVPRPS
jgi:GrpB-like predicted nucleotidyltransferase (UPF0157 family)